MKRPFRKDIRSMSDVSYEERAGMGVDYLEPKIARRRAIWKIFLAGTASRKSDTESISQFSVSFAQRNRL